MVPCPPLCPPPQCPASSLSPVCIWKSHRMLAQYFATTTITGGVFHLGVPSLNLLQMFLWARQATCLWHYLLAHYTLLLCAGLSQGLLCTVVWNLMNSTSARPPPYLILNTFLIPIFILICNTILVPIFHTLFKNLFNIIFKLFKLFLTIWVLIPHVFISVQHFDQLQ